jgi:hypothetical protein
VALATPTALLAAVLLAPTALAMVTDPAPGRPTGRTVLLFGLAASVHSFAMLWHASGSMDGALRIATDVTSPALAWAAQGAGWLLAEAMPVVLRIALDTAAAARLMHLRQQRAVLAEEWNLPVPQDAKPSQGPATGSRT